MKPSNICFYKYCFQSQPLHGHNYFVQIVNGSTFHQHIPFDLFLGAANGGDWQLPLCPIISPNIGKFETFIYLFIQNLYSALFTNKRALMRYISNAIINNNNSRPNSRFTYNALT